MHSKHNEVVPGRATGLIGKSICSISLLVAALLTLLLAGTANAVSDHSGADTKPGVAGTALAEPMSSMTGLLLADSRLHDQQATFYQLITTTQQGMGNE